MSDVSKMRVHSMTFSEEEYHKINEFIDAEGNFYINFKELYPEVWKFMNRMSYVVAHGTEEGWGD